jgi:hypothetical protein
MPNMSYLAKNLAAISAVLPAMAKRIEEAPIPQGFAPTMGTDGTPTFARTAAVEGRTRVEWLGGTSMPAASARAMVSSLDAFSGGACGLGLSIGTGYEWAAFAARLPRAQLVYVYESEPAFLRMALEICDLSPLLAERRVILLTGPAEVAAIELAAFLAANLGFEPPSVLHPLVSIAPERRNLLLAAGEKIVRHVISERQLVLAQLQEKLIAACRQPAPTSASHAPTLAFLLTPQYPQERPIGRQTGTRNLILDRHDSASLALRLKTLADRPAGVAAPRIISDLFRLQLEPLPPDIPVETWVPPLIGPVYWDRIPPAASLAPQDRVIVHFGYHAQRLHERGIPESQIILRPLTPPTPIENRKKGGGEAKTENAPRRVALIADLPPSDAVSLAIELPTHQAVFAAAREIVADEYLTVHPGMSADILRRALARAGVDPKVDDPALKDPMLRIIRDVLIPAVPRLTLATALVREGLPLTLLGDWPGLHTPLADLRQISFETYTPTLWDDVALFVHFAPDGAFSPILWDAAAAQVAIVAPQPSASLGGGGGAGRGGGLLGQILLPEKEFAQPPAKNLIATIKALLRDIPRREKLAAAATAHLAQGLTQT